VNVRRPSLDDVVLDRAIGPASVPAKRPDTVLVHERGQSLVFSQRPLRNVHVRGIEHDRVLRHELLLRDHALSLEIRKHAISDGRDVDACVLREANLDVDAEPIGIEDVVVPADTVKRRLTGRVVRPMNVSVPLDVEAEVEDKHFD